MLRSLTDAVLRHIDRHRVAVVDVNSLCTDGELVQVVARATVNQSHLRMMVAESAVDVLTVVVNDDNK